MAEAERPPEEQSQEPVAPEPLDLERIAGEDASGRAAWILLETYRWTVLYGEAPYDEVWDRREGYPSTRDVVEVFGGWEDLWELTGLYDSYYLRAVDAADEDYEKFLAERADLRAQRQATQRELGKARQERESLDDRLREMRRQVDRAKEKASAATDALASERARAERAERRAEAAEREVRAPAPAPSPAPAPDDRVAELRQEVEGAERFADALTDQLQAAHDRLAERDREIAELRRALGRVDEELGPARDAEPEPADVLEAVRRAADRLPNLVFAPRAFESADDSPFARPSLIMENLERLDQLAARYLEGDMGEKVSDLAFRLGMNWRGGISERTRTRYGKDYSFPYEGRTWELGPHLRIGSGQGAGAIARVYLTLHPGDDELPRAVIVGHVGRHLPDSTT
jgi:predicted  nucleic acid-binding Zn-ribbon protein